MKNLYKLLFFLICSLSSMAQSNWVKKNIPSTADLEQVVFSDSLHGWIATYDGNILKTTDGGENWSLQNAGNALPLYSLYFTDSLNGWTGGYLGKILHTNDGGLSWTLQSNGLTDIVNSIYFLDDSLGFAAGSRGNILQTLNGGQNWNEIYLNTNFSIKSVYFLNYQSGFAVGTNGFFLKTIDGGLTWNQIISGHTESFNAVIFITPDLGFLVGTGGLILRTMDGGNSWLKMISPSTSNLNSIIFENEMIGWICGANGVILNSKNGGSSWSNSSLLSQGTYTSVSLLGSENLFVCGYSGSALKFYPVLTETQTVQNPGDTLDFSNLGLLLSFQNFTPPVTGQPQVQVSGHSKAPIHSPVQDSIAGLFNKFYWNIESNLDSFNVTMCVLFDSTRFNTTSLQQLNLMYSTAEGNPWKVIEVIPFRMSGRICATINHFSNWTIGLSRPDAKVRIDTILYNSTQDFQDIKIKNDLSGMEYGYRQKPGQTDTIFARQYAINPGGDLPAEITGFLGSYYEFRSSTIDTVFMYIDIASQVGYNESEKTNYVLLFRPDPSLEWTIVSTQRVRRGQKEAIFSKRADFSGQYIIGKSYSNNEFFEVIPTVIPGCLNDTSYFSAVVAGGIGNTTISWSGGEGFTGNGAEAWYIFKTVDTVFYTVSAEDENKAVSYIDTVFAIDCVTGIDYENELNSFDLFPNPIKNGTITISIPWKEKTEVSLLNSIGEVLHVNIIPFDSNNRTLNFNTLNLPKGVYLIKIQSRSKIIGKLMIIN